jgi:hypothetical protein
MERSALPRVIGRGDGRAVESVRGWDTEWKREKIVQTERDGPRDRRGAWVTFA